VKNDHTCEELTCWVHWGFIDLPQDRQQSCEQQQQHLPPSVCMLGLRAQHKLIVLKGYVVICVISNGICLKTITAARSEFPDMLTTGKIASVALSTRGGQDH